MRLGLGVVACALLISSCNRRQPIPVPPTSSSTLAIQSADREFATGDYGAAARDYERYLQIVAAEGDRDHAFFQLGLIYTMPDTERLDWPKALDYLNRLVMEFPESSLKPAAQLILTMREQSTQLGTQIRTLTTETTQLRNETAQLRNQLANLRNEDTQLRSEAVQLRANTTQLNEQLAKNKMETEQLMMDLDKKEQRIKQLNTELDRLIRIESERRPTSR